MSSSSSTTKVMNPNLYFLSLAGSKLKSKLSTTFNESVVGGGITGNEVGGGGRIITGNGNSTKDGGDKSTAPIPNSSISLFAQKQLVKMGWKPGECVGKRRKSNKNDDDDDDNEDDRDTNNNNKNKNGVKSKTNSNNHGLIVPIQVKKRSNELELSGIGHDVLVAKEKIETHQQEWWKDNVGSTLAKLASKKNKKNTKTKKEDKKAKKKKSNNKGSKRKRDGDDTTATTIINATRRYTDEELFQATGGARFGMRAGMRQNGKWSRTTDTIINNTTDDNGTGTNMEKGTTKITQQELIAKQAMEWDGRSIPQILLSESPTTRKRKRSKDTDLDDIDNDHVGNSRTDPITASSSPSSSSTMSNDDSSIVQKSEEKMNKKKEKKEKKRKKKEEKKKKRRKQSDDQQDEIDEKTKGKGKNKKEKKTKKKTNKTKKDSFK